MQIVYSERHRSHAPDQVLRDGQPFISEDVPARADVILAALAAAGIGPVVAPDDHGMAPILAVHDPDYVAFLLTAYQENAAFFGAAGPVFTYTFAVRRDTRPAGFPGLRGYYAFDAETPILEGTWEAAYWSAQCALSAADRLLSGEAAAYALCRPPGHHAAADLYGGFCYLNNAAIAARHLQARSDRSTVAILDIDYHHGNGTQAIFWRDPRVLFCSLHVRPDQGYPFYWGSADERGEGAGRGTTLNLPLPLGTGDAAYLATLDTALAAIRAYVPRYLVVSAGLDIVQGDLIGHFEVTTEGLREIGRRIAALGLPTVIVQEGGYCLDTLRTNVAAFLSPFAT
jgi:acetoin utilization deacetylase AcuC-like enzyme